MSKISLPILLAFLTVNAYGQNNYKNSPPAYGSENRIAWEKSEIPVNSEFTLKLVWLYNPLNESMYVGEDKKGLFNSRDGGRSWIRIDDGTFQVESTNTTFHSLQYDNSGALYSLTPYRDGVRIFRSTDTGKYWKSVWPKNAEMSQELEKKLTIGWSERLWIDSRTTSRMYLLTVRYGHESSATRRQLWFTDDNWHSFDRIGFPDSWDSVAGVDVQGKTICYSDLESIHCSEDNGITWNNLSLESIADSISSEALTFGLPGVTINKRTGELILFSEGKLFETTGKRTSIRRMVDSSKHFNDLFFHPRNTYPIYGIEVENADEPWKIVKIDSSGKVKTFDGPKDRGFRIKLVDFSKGIFLVWTVEGILRGELN